MPNNSPRYPEERRLATVLFADVQGFTSFAEQLDFETVSDLLKGIWKQLDAAIEAHNGYIDKHLGDGIMAIWGAPFAGENDAEQAVAAGLDLVKALNKLCAQSRIPGAVNLKLRVGINTGQVFAGYIGSRNEYTVLGDTVNLANRLEQMAEAGTVVISENTLRLVHSNFRVRRIEPVRVKGKTELIQPFVVEERLSSSSRIHEKNTSRLRINMVGRANDLKKLKLLYESTFKDHKPQMALISGDVGIGKTRLLVEFGNLLEGSGEKVTIISTRGLSHATKVPFYLWRILLRNCFEVTDREPTQAATDKLTDGILSLWENDPPESKLEAEQLLGEVLGPSGHNHILTEEELKRVLFLTRELMRRYSLDKRLVLFIDDLHWADRESLQLLANLLSAEEAPFRTLVVGATRPELLKTQSHWHNLAQVITLNPLEMTPDTIRLAYPELRYQPDELLNEIALHAEGNPYFLKAIVKNLIKGGLLEMNTRPAELQDQLLAQMPESLRATLQARMDSLSREARTVALLASVVGRVFWVGAVLAEARSTPIAGSTPMINIPEAVIDRFIQDGLRQLVHAELAFPRSGSKFSDDQEYIFKNSYLRDVAYSLLPNRNRAQYHKAVAEWMGQSAEPAFQSMAREHERNAAAAAKVTTGGLPPILGE